MFLRQFLQDFKKVKNKRGIRHIIKRIPSTLYRRTIRKFLPTTGYATRNGVPNPNIPTKIFDDYLPSDWWHLTENKPNEDQGIIELQRETINPRDDVVIVGGGYGVTMCYAYELMDCDGSITVYEGSNKRLEILNWLKRYLDLQDNVDIHHAIVGEEFKIDGESSAPYLPPKKLPPCDVLILDCQGSEYPIIANMDIRPETVIMEVHPSWNKKSKMITQLLRKKGYEIQKYKGTEGTDINKNEFESYLDNPGQSNDYWRSPPVILGHRTKSNTVGE